MKDYLIIGSSPSNEECAQVGQNDYEVISKIELKTLINQLKRTAPSNFLEKVNLTTAEWNHEFGTYEEVIVEYDTDIEGSEEAAFYFEAAAEDWDEESKNELRASLPLWYQQKLELI